LYRWIGHKLTGYSGVDKLSGGRFLALSWS
jgi:hypothetical protein